MPHLTAAKFMKALSDRKEKEKALEQTSWAMLSAEALSGLVLSRGGSGQLVTMEYCLRAAIGHPK